MTTDQEFAQYMRSLPRKRSQDEVDRVERQHDTDRGLYAPHSGSHHVADESRH